MESATSQVTRQLSKICSSTQALFIPAFMCQVHWCEYHHRRCLLDNFVSLCTILCCAVLISHYTFTVHLYQLAVNFRDGNVTPITTKSPYKLLHGTEFPNSLQLYIIFSDEEHLTDWLWHHLLHVAPTTTATAYQKNMLDLTPKSQEWEPYLLNMPYCCTIKVRNNITNKLLKFLIQHILEQSSTINCPGNFINSKLYTKGRLLRN